MFDPKKLSQEFFNMSKDYWALSTQMLLKFQEQNEHIINTLVAQGLIAQQEGKKMFDEWLKRAKEAREQFNKQIEDNWKNIESTFGTSSKTKKQTGGK